MPPAPSERPVWFHLRKACAVGALVVAAAGCGHSTPAKAFNVDATQACLQRDYGASVVFAGGNGPSGNPAAPVRVVGVTFAPASGPPQSAILYFMRGRARDPFGMRSERNVYVQRRLNLVVAWVNTREEPSQEIRDQLNRCLK